MKKQGISLIVMTITIIVMVIISGAAILSLKQDNQINKAAQVVFKSDITEFKNTLSSYITSRVLEDSTFSPQYFDVTALSEIKAIIPNLPETYYDIINIENGQIVYVGTDSDERSWARSLNATTDTLIAIYTQYELPDPETLVD